MSSSIESNKQTTKTYTRNQVSDLYKKSPIPTYLWQFKNDDFILVDYNEAANRMTRGGVEKFIGKRARDYHQDDPIILEELDTCFSKKTAFTREMPYYFRTLDETKHLSVTYSFIPDDIVLVHTEDITVRKNAEMESKKYSTILNNANYAAMILDTEFNIVYVNEYCASIHGYTPEEIIGKNVRIFHNSEQLKTVEPMLSHAKELDPFMAREIWHTRKDGSVFPMLMNGNIVYDDASRPRYLTATAIDISDKLEAQKKHRELAKKLTDIEKQTAFGQFGAWLAHEINNPLHIILGKLFLLERNLTGTDATVNEQLTKIREQVDRISRLAKNVLDRSKPYSHLLKPVEINSTLNTVLDMVLNTIPESANIDLSLSDDDLPVMGDALYLELLFKNILLNAVESISRDGSIVITSSNHEGNTVAVHIKDTGHGMPQSELENIFEPFYTTKQKAGGTGLGLPICKYIVDQHNGSIEVSSTPDRGTVFSIYLPAAQ
ncbi:MAG: ATP-binding protein [candidate division KSB1 bacterium]|nr:ATP-binding protein [candidate division KSB1 bacterium]